MRLKFSMLIIVTILLLTVIGCNTNEGSSGNKVDFNENDFERLVSPNNNLGFKMMSKVESVDDNILVSPTSLLVALSMVYNGSAGETKDEIANALQVEGISIEDLNKANASLMAMLNKDSEEIELTMANSIWLNDQYSFLEDFAQNNKDYFQAEIETINVGDNKSADLINEWVQQATNNKIDDIVESPLDSNFMSLLINAIYFNGTWTYEFDEALTREATFNLSDGNTKNISFMELHRGLLYTENEHAQIVKLPYGDGEMSMNIYLPKENIEIDEFMEIAIEENLSEWNEQLVEEEGTIVLPKFQLEYETVLNDTLKQLGMEQSFSEQADFSLMIDSDESLTIDEVRQKTFIDVNEEGTEAAAVTSVEVKMTSLPIDGPFYMDVNRPFFMTISEDVSNTILFMGLIGNPKQGN